ncbi:LytR/AlgR family response regulator transcription factor [Piscinibacter sakaiensis]|uniref:Response regulator of the LytR/AlgR family n=1 Tax=Piscinibacter sakaiensis TaxID=1547922 RepID=A0A0K8P2B9_PISS1|nr:LytTR family DNA-binding domain-containing protein [Piscinibacter sakaiensis]GAP36822.1 response regulator of the LytR/AlgR family [Piscinibacter sakaiensis]
MPTDATDPAERDPGPDPGTDATALIADDEPHLAAFLQQQLAIAWPALRVVGLARNGPEAAQAIAALAPDVAFLDIRMPGLSGLEVAQGIEGRTRVVFVTAYDAFAVQAFEQEAVDYVLKPVRADRLARTVARVQRVLAADRAADTGPEAGADGPPGAAGDAPAGGADASGEAGLAAVLARLLPGGTAPGPRLRHVRASRGELTTLVDVAEVRYFHADEKYTVVRTADAEHLIRTPVAELARQLDPERFWQVHRATIVNVDHLAGTRRDALSRLFVRFRDLDHELPVSRAYVHRFRAM